jgi:Ca2+-binding RTX toxin-like protein
MASYIWSNADGKTTGTAASLSAYATASAGVATTGDNWTIYGTSVSNPAITIDNGVAPKDVTYYGGSAADVVSLKAMTASKGNIIISTGAGIDNITASIAAVATQTSFVTLDGGAGADVVTLGDVGNGRLTIVYDALDTLVNTAAASLTVSGAGLAAGVNWNVSNVGATLCAGATVANTGINFATATTTADSVSKLIGTSYADTLMGGASVTLDGGAGADILKAGGNNVVMVYDASDSLVTANTNTGVVLNASLQTSAVQLYFQGNTQFTGGIATFIGGSGDDDIRGTTGMTEIRGGAGNDAIWGGTGATATTLTGGAGNDKFFWGAGEGSDTITYDSSAGASQSSGDTVYLYNISGWDLIGSNVFVADGAIANAGSVVYNGASLVLASAATQGQNAAHHFVSSEGWTFDVVFDNTGTVTGTAGVTDNLVAKAATATTFDGKGNHDNLYGNTGADYFYYYAGDQVYSGTGADTLDASKATVGTQIFMDSIVAGTAATSWNIKGTAYNDEIRGQSGGAAGVNAQTLNGGAGDDAIWGGSGSTNNDSLIGGLGVDTYFYGLDQGADIIAAGTNSYNGNALDKVKLYDVALSQVAAALSGNDMVFTVTGTSGNGTLTLQDWNNGTINKLTSVYIGTTAYTLSANASGTGVFTAV